MKKSLFGLLIITVAFLLLACGNASDDTTLPAENQSHIHNFVDELVPATCVAEGKLISKCECGLIYSETVLPMTVHSYPEIDCEKDSLCTVCGQLLAEKTGHQLYNIETVVAATCDTTGVSRATCQLCNKVVESVIPTSHDFNKIDRVGDKYSATCSKCSRTVESINAVNLHDEEKSGLTYANGKVSFLGGGSGTTYAYNFPAEIVGNDKAPYQIEFTLTFDKGTGTSNGMETINNSGNGRHLLKYPDASFSLLRQYPISDGNGGWLTREILVGSMVGFGVDPVPLIRMTVGESAKFTFVIDPKTETVDIFVNDAFVATREKADKVFSAKSAYMIFGDSSIRTTKTMGWTVSDISIVRAAH